MNDATAGTSTVSRSKQDGLVCKALEVSRSGGIFSGTLYNVNRGGWVSGMEKKSSRFGRVDASSASSTACSDNELAIFSAVSM